MGTLIKMMPFRYMLIIMFWTIRVEAFRRVRHKVHKHLTFNTALVDFSLLPGVVENNREARRDGIIQALNESDADLVCLQEVWIGSDMEAIVDGVSGNFPHSYSMLHDENGTLPDQANGLNEPACNFTLLASFADCAQAAGCLDEPPTEQGTCAVAKCIVEFTGLLQDSRGLECVTCLFVKLQSSVAEVFNDCGAPEPAVGLRTMNTLGLLVLSKKRLRGRRFVRFYDVPVLVDRGYLEFKFDGYLKGACTHLTSTDNAGFQEPFLSATFPKLTDQNLFEIKELAKRFGRRRPFVLLGDMNVGKAFAPDITPIQPEHYEELKRAFKRTDESDECTFCPGEENFYNVNQGGERSVIDHVMGNGLFFKRGEVLFKTTTSNVTDGSTELPLSDHFAYQVLSSYRHRRRYRY